MRLFLALFACLSIAGFIALAKHDDDHDWVLAAAATGVERLERITAEPHRMDDSTAMLCVAPVMRPHQVHDGYVDPAWCHVYVNEPAGPVIRSGAGVYPEGSLIVKSKLTAPDSKEPEIYTVMRKMAAGYDAEQGDWEYSVIDGRSARVVASGRIDSCIACHAAYPETDYVTRAYLSPSGADKPFGESTTDRQSHPGSH